jgi:hypothetical protein
MTGMRALTVTFATAAIMVAAAVGFREMHTRMLTRHIRNRLSVVPAEQAEDLLQQALVLGDPGIHVLVEALGSPRAVTSQAAMRVLTSEMTRWELLRASQSTAKLALLANALAERVDEFETSARRDAAELVTRILLWPLGDHAVERTTIVAACEKVLRATTAKEPQLPSGRSRLAIRRQPSRSDSPSDAPNPLRGSTPSARLSSNLELDPPRDGRLDDRPDFFPAAPRQQATLAENPDPAAELADGPAMLPPILTQRAFLPSSRLESASTEESTGRSEKDIRYGQASGRNLMDEPWRAGSSQAARAPATQQSFQHVGEAYRSDFDYAPLGARAPKQAGPQGEQRVPPVNRPLAPRWSDFSNVELIRRLRANDLSAADAARAELVRRGFTEVNLEMARQLFDPDPVVRMKLVRVLPELQSVDAEPWLRQLSQDPDPRIRRQALAALAERGQETVNHAASTRETKTY